MKENNSNEIRISYFALAIIENTVCITANTIDFYNPIIAIN